MLRTSFIFIFTLVVLDVNAKRRDWVVRMTLAKHISTSTTNNFMGTSSEHLKFGANIDIILIKQMLQAVWENTFAMGQNACMRAHLLTTVPKLVPKACSTDYARFLYRAAVFHPRRPASQILNLKVLFEHQIIGGAAKT